MEDQRRPPDPDDIDARFQEIVAGLRADPPPAPRPPVSPAEPADPPAATPGPGPGSAGWRSWEAEDEEEHFVPPPPPPLPAGDLHFWAILVGLVGGPLLVLLSAVVPVLSGGWTAVGAVLTVAGFLLLVLRQPRDRHDEDDSGARV